MLGSGNLTQKGLRHNREAYSIIPYNTENMEKVTEEWVSWYTHSLPFLFDIDDPIVMTRAKQNTEQIRAVSVAKASVKKNSIKQKTSDELADIYKNQPKDIKRPSTKVQICPKCWKKLSRIHWINCIQIQTSL